MRPGGLFLLAFALALRAADGTQIAVPIYIEDNHAGSFYWLAQHLDPEETCTLIHFDAHSDASAVFGSDEIRQRLRRISSIEERARLLEAWRGEGDVQCFNWIEPLMPAPVAETIWVPPSRIKTDDAQREADRQLDGQLEASPRVAGPLSEHYRAARIDGLERELAPDRPLLITIDLDFFAGLSPNERSAEFERVWRWVTERPNIRAITIAVSRPYLRDDEEADALITLALRGALSWPTAQIEFAPFRSVGHDRSLRARELSAQNRIVPAFDLERSSGTLRALLLANEERVAVRNDAKRYQTILQDWRRAAPVFRLIVKDCQPSTDEIWRVPAEATADIEIVAQPWDARFDRVRWIVEVPQYLCCNLTSDRALFAHDAPPRPRWREKELALSAQTLPLSALTEFFDCETGCGAVRLKARIESAEWIRETPAIEIRRARGSGFRAALSEQFALPYLFGSGALRHGSNTGPETGWGADCANFVVSALRRQGLRIPWSNPKQLRTHLELVKSFDAEDLERGIILHLGSHVAALMEDRPPLGRLNGDDIVAHQLEGAPALISVDELLRLRQVSRFDLLRVPAPADGHHLLIGGDVMLGRSVGDRIESGVDPFAGIHSLLEEAETKIANLECVLSERGTPQPDKRFHLRAPLAAAEVLRAAGINAVGLANNHADDFGPEARADMVKSLGAANVTVINERNAATIWKLENGARVALLAINDLAPRDRGAIGREIEETKTRSDFVIALLHWGEENTSIVTERQRETARWLIDHGVDLIAGSHPHRIQPLDYYHGRPVIYSLGNLVFDGAPGLAGWNAGNLLEVGFGEGKTAPSVRLIPITLDAGGLPHAAPRAETAWH